MLSRGWSSKRSFWGRARWHGCSAERLQSDVYLGIGHCPMVLSIKLLVSYYSIMPYHNPPSKIKITRKGREQMEETKRNQPFSSPFHQIPLPTYPYMISKPSLPRHYTVSPLQILLIGDKARSGAYARVLQCRMGSRGGRKGTRPWLFGGEATSEELILCPIYVQGEREQADSKKKGRGKMHKP